MALERLKGMQYYGLSSVKYDSSGLHLNGDAASFPEIFTSVGVGKVLGECRMLDNVYQLGWNTLVVLEKDGNKFNLMGIKGYRYDGVQEGRSGSYNQVVARAVDTGTFVMLQSNNRIVMAHLDAELLEEGLQDIPSVIESADGVTGICSYAPDDKVRDGGKRTEFFDALKRKYPQIVPVVRRDEDPNGRDYFGHFEIGIYFDGKDTALYGDVTRLPSRSESKTDSYCFDSVDSLRNTVILHMKRSGPKFLV